jgi:hypothetical protein
LKLAKLSLLVVVSLLISLASADEISRRAAAEELLSLTKVDQMIKPLFTQMQAMMEQQFAQMGVPEDLQPILKRHQERLFVVLEETLDLQTMKRDFVSIYVDTFTEDELKGVVAFYKTPVGQAFLDKMPLLMSRSMQASQKRMPDIFEKMKVITAKLVDEMKEEIERKQAERRQRPRQTGL